MRRLRLFAVVAALAVAASFSQVQAASNVPNKNAGEESDSLAAAQSWFTDQRAAPNDFINPNAFAAVRASALSLPVTGGTWTERTSPSAPNGVDFSDSPKYVDPTSGFSNSGAGDRYVAGRMTALAAAPGGVLFAGAADGGVWKSTNGGNTWAPVFDSQGTLSIGALLVTTSGSGYTVYAGTGEANTSSDSYAGIGVLKSTNGGSSWSQVGGSELNGALVFRLAQDGSKIFAATSHGLYVSTGGTWTAVLQPGGAVAPGGNFNLNVGNMISDVAVIPGTGGSQVLAVAGWRGGAPTNGFYVSNDGGSTFNYIANPQGWVPAKAQGRVTIAYSSDGGRLYAIAQSAYLLNVGTNGKTLLQGVYESNHGATGPWTKIATAEKLQASGSAQKLQRIGKGYAPGVQAWYNQFLAVDPANANHVYLGLEEVYETQNDGASWNTIAPYWNFGFSCYTASSQFEGTCNHQQAHSDQHAAMIANGTLYIGNDGGVYSKSITDHSVGNWNDLNAHMDALQYYSANGSGGAHDYIYGGLQDNGSNVVFNPTGTVPDDNNNPITVSSVQIFGGDGGYTIVDPRNDQNVITEYTSLTALKSTDGGQNWTFIVPNDPDPRFISPIAMDRTNPDHLLAGGAIVWNSEAGIAGTTSWTNIFDVRTATGANAAAEVTALDGVTIGGVQYVAAAWCGACNASFSTGGGFHAGIVFLKSTDGGSTWTVTQQSVASSSAAGAIANRYIAGVRIDTANPNHAYVALSGYSRRWMIGPDDPGLGHVFETNDGGATWANVSGGLPDVPMDDIVYKNGHLYAATDFGVFESGNDGTTWYRYGTGLPNVVVDQLTEDPNGNLVAATHGRGIWTIAAL